MEASAEAERLPTHSKYIHAWQGTMEEPATWLTSSSCSWSDEVIKESTIVKVLSHRLGQLVTTALHQVKLHDATEDPGDLVPLTAIDELRAIVLHQHNHLRILILDLIALGLRQGLV